jgi:hypothetical protein
MARGLFLYRTDAIGPEVEGILSRNKSSTNPNDAETAHFYLARYYQRNYYLLYDKTGMHPPDALQKSSRLFSEFLSRFDNGRMRQWTSDARFYASLAYLQQGKRSEARKVLEPMNTSRDGSIYVYQVVWSSNPADVFDATYKAAEMRTFLLNTYRRNPRATFVQVVTAIKAECMRLKSPQQQIQQMQQQKLFPKR